PLFGFTLACFAAFTHSLIHSFTHSLTFTPASPIPVHIRDSSISQRRGCPGCGRWRDRNRALRRSATRCYPTGEAGSIYALLQSVRLVAPVPGWPSQSS